MKCPFCGGSNTQVIDTRIGEEGSVVRRRRRCLLCDQRFSTQEFAELRMPCVIKEKGEREDFLEEKLRLSFLRALHKRPVSTLLIDRAVEQLKQRILYQNVREIPSRQIGEFVMQTLSQLDKVAYVRYASVYRSFQDVSEFSSVVEEVQNQSYGFVCDG